MRAETAYLFRHALLRDAAYEMQLPALPPGFRARADKLQRQANRQKPGRLVYGMMGSFFAGGGGRPGRPGNLRRVSGKRAEIHQVLTAPFKDVLRHGKRGPHC
jgi:hypothetical protein